MIMLIAYLTAIKYYSKSIHYNLKSIDFYSNHLLTDRIQKNIDDYIDRINEVCFLGSLEDTPAPKDVLTETLNIIPEEQEDNKNYLHELLKLLQLTHIHLNDLKNLYSLSEGDINLIGEIDENIQQSIGLLNRTLI